MPRLDSLPNELQGLIISKLDTKSKAKLRVASTEMRRAVDNVEPPTGSYERKSGRFQSFWLKKNRQRCHDKLGIVTNDARSKHGYGRAKVNGFIDHVFDECVKYYRRSTLMGIIHVMRTETPDEFVHFFVKYYRGDVNSEQAWDHLMEDLRDQKEFLRRVTRLIKQWGKTDKRYAETYHLIMRRKEILKSGDVKIFCTPYEERMHKDRFMDAMIVQYVAAISNIDVTKPGYTVKGRERTLSEQIKYVTGLCRARTRDDAKQKNVKTPAKQSKQKKKN